MARRTDALAAVFKSFRFWWMWMLAVGVIAWSYFTDPSGGKDTEIWMLWMAKLVVAVGIVYLARRSLIEARSHELFEKAREEPMAAAIALLAVALITASLVFVAGARAADLPKNAQKYLPALDDQINVVWPTMPQRSVMGALIEQETCISLKHSKCWNPRAELKTSREYGFGLGQLTIAYRSDGSVRFNKWQELKDKYAELANWEWESRYDASMQMRAILLMNRECFGRIMKLKLTDSNALAMCDAAYNGGFGSVLNDRRLCAARPGCDPDVWFGNVELYSQKSRQKWHGYGKSPYDINREHVLNVMVVRRPKYAQWWGEV